MTTKIRAKKTLKQVDQETAERVINNMDMEGVWYALREGYMDDLHGTTLEPLMEEAKVSMRKFEDAMEKLREKFGIQEN